MTGRVAHVAISPDPLSVARALEAVEDPAAGGLGIFVGTVRDHDGARPVRSLEYQAHPSALTELSRVCAGAADLPGVTCVAAIHRVGLLAVGDLAVVVAVSAPHRGQALDACRWLIDTLKEQVPIWKRQVYADGSADWVAAC